MLTSPTASLISTGIGAATNIYGGKKQADANAAALQAQIDYNNKALAAALDQQQYERQQDEINRNIALERQDYQRGQYNQYVSRLQPFASAGQTSLPRLTALLEPSQIGLGGGPSSAPNAVRLRAPDGTESMVDPAHVAHYLALGAMPVNG